MSHAILSELNIILSWYAAAFHLLLPYVITSLRDMIVPVIALTAIFSALMVHPRTRRVTMAVIKFTNRHAPAWAKPAMIAAAFFPGQADEIALVAILLVPILRNSRNRRTLSRTVRYAWNAR